MEMMIIAAVAIVAFAAVLIPLFRRGPGGVDAREFEGDTPARARKPAGRPPADRKHGGGGGTRTPPRQPPVVQAVDPMHGEGVVPPMAAGPVSPVDAGGAPDPADVPDASAGSDDELELEIRRYRTALRAGTVCGKCGQANPADSAFCFDCGERLPLSESREFE
jgi:hypothetical protein